MANLDSGLPRRTYRLINETRGKVLAERVARADGFWQRLIGLLLRNHLHSGEGLWIEPCNGIHTIGMRFPIDLVMLDRFGNVIRVVRNIPPFRVIRSSNGWKGAVEMPPGDLSEEDLQIGDRLRLAE